MRRLARFLVPLLLAAATVRAGDLPAAKPVVTVAADGFPTGTDTPEGAACDLARAFMHDDAALFLATCVEPFGTPEDRNVYHEFLRTIVVQMKIPVAAGSAPSPQSPREINKCFAARHLTKSGPAAYAAAAGGFEDVMFVDVDATLQSGDAQLCRTLVLKNKQGKWAVYPEPDVTPSLSDGLDDELPSTRDFSDAYATRQTPTPAATPTTPPGP